MNTAMTSPSTMSLCTFRLHDVVIGIDVADVQEVLVHQQATGVPLMPPTIQGLMNLRGEIVTTLDLRRRLGLPAADAVAPALDVVVRSPGGAVALVVDEIGDVIEASDRDIELAPPTLKSPQRDFVAGVLQRVEGLVLLIDLARVLDPTTIRHHDPSTEVHEVKP